MHFFFCSKLPPNHHFPYVCKENWCSIFLELSRKWTFLNYSNKQPDLEPNPMHVYLDVSPTIVNEGYTHVSVARIAASEVMVKSWPTTFLLWEIYKKCWNPMQLQVYYPLPRHPKSRLFWNPGICLTGLFKTFCRSCAHSHGQCRYSKFCSLQYGVYL